MAPSSTPIGWSAAVGFVLILFASTASSQTALSVDGEVESSGGGFVFPDGTVQPTSTAEGAPPLRTALSRCFSEAGVERDCSGTGEDAEFEAGAPWPTPRFTDHGDGTITDNLTGLMWMQDARCFGDGIAWQDALDWIVSLNTTPVACANYTPLTYTDWRMPQIRELITLVDRREWNDPLPDGHPFLNVVNKYLASTSSVDDPDSAWIVRFVYGHVFDGSKILDNDFPTEIWPVRGGSETAPGGTPVADSGLTRCFDTSGVERPCAGTGEDGEIRAGAAWPTPRYVDNGDGTIADRLTGLTWLRDADCPAGAMTWQQALDWVSFFNTVPVNCDGYIGLTHTDWRLPNANELLSLVDYSQAIPALTPGVFVNASAASDYWSSTTVLLNPDEAWVVDVGGIGSSVREKKAGQTNRVFPVRGDP